MKNHFHITPIGSVRIEQEGFYIPMERVKNVTAPAWCRHWPQWQEEAASFNWQDEINFG